MRKTIAFAAGIAFSVMAAFSAHAEDLISQTTAQQMGNILKQNSFAVTDVGLTSDGNPQVMAKFDQTVFQVLFYDCNTSNPVRCTRIQLRADYNAPTIQFEPLNDYNAAWVFGKAYRYQTDGGFGASIEYAINLEGGVSQANLKSSLDIWRDTVINFERDAMGFSNQPPN